MRLNAFLAQAGVASRRKADELIKIGRVEVNGKTGELNTIVNENDEVKVDGKSVKLQKLRYILYYKPARTVTTLSDPEGRPTILDDVKVSERVVPVGRLDFDTTGALLLTNDGELANKLMHPSSEIDKVYEVELHSEPSSEQIKSLQDGVVIDGKKTAPAKISSLGNKKIELTIHEGKYHQVKKMCQAVGLEVSSLHRSKYAKMDLAGLKVGQWRDVDPNSIC